MLIREWTQSLGVASPQGLLPAVPSPEHAVMTSNTGTHVRLPFSLSLRLGVTERTALHSVRCGGDDEAVCLGGPLASAGCGNTRFPPYLLLLPSCSS